MKTSEPFLVGRSLLLVVQLPAGITSSLLNWCREARAFLAGDNGRFVAEVEKVEL